MSTIGSKQMPFSGASFLDYLVPMHGMMEAIQMNTGHEIEKAKLQS